MKLKPTHIELPTFVVKGQTSMPPVVFEIIGSIQTTLRDEVFHLRIQLNQLRKTAQKDQKNLWRWFTVKQDITDIGKSLHRLRASNLTPTISFAQTLRHDATQWPARLWQTPTPPATSRPSQTTRDGTPQAYTASTRTAQNWISHDNTTVLSRTASEHTVKLQEYDRLSKGHGSAQKQNMKVLDDFVCILFWRRITSCPWPSGGQLDHHEEQPSPPK